MVFCLVGCNNAAPVDDIDIGPVISPTGCEMSGGEVNGNECDCPEGTQYGYSSGLCI